VSEGVDGEGDVIDEHQAGGAAQDEAAPGVAEGPAHQRRQEQPEGDPHPGIEAVLEAHQAIALEVRNGMHLHRHRRLAQHPAHVRVPEALARVVGIERAVRPLVVAPMIRRPHHRRVLEGAGADRQQRRTQQRMRVVRLVGEQAVIAGGQAEDAQR
jgi:hypothetical protein